MEKNYDILAEMNTCGRKIWNVFVDGKFVQCVGATNNSKYAAQRYAQSKYPGRVVELVFREWRD